GDEAPGEVGHRADLARGAEQLRGDLSQGDRREVRARGEGDRVRGHRPLQARGVEAGPVHPHGPLRRLQVAQREAQRLQPRQDSARARDASAARPTPRSHALLKGNPNGRPIIPKPYYWLVAVFNKKEGLMTNQKLRQAGQAAIDIEAIMKTEAGGRAGVYRRA